MLILVLLILSFKKNTKLNIKKIYGNYENTRRLTLVIMRYHGFVDIYVNVFYKRNEYLYIGIPSGNEVDQNVKWFNDVPRAMQK